jgi:eukaryotic-like serine/threonine-protein kinase
MTLGVAVTLAATLNASRGERREGSRQRGEEGYTLAENPVTDGGPAHGIGAGALSALLGEIARGSPERWGSTRLLRAGATIGRFELVREVGRGGFGVVWEAKDTELGRTVAFKALFAGTPDVREERLLREAEAAARLSHPNIVTLFDVGRTEDGPYLVLEFLRGETLARRMDQGPIPVPEALRVGIEVAKALAHAHSHGVIHRDLTPGNVFLCEDGQVKVLDLGMAHAFGRPKLGGGTPTYMAPEQEEDAPEDERTDVFALGVVLHRMLGGEHPYPRTGSARWRKASELEVSGAPALGMLIGRMLALRPTERPRNANEVLAALSAFQRELERAPGPFPGAVRKRGRSLARIALACALVAAVTGGAAALSWRALRAGRSPRPDSSPQGPVSLAVLPLTNLSGDPAQEYLSDGITEEITGKLSRLDGLEVTARTSAARYKAAPRSAREIGAELGVAYLVEGSVRRSADRIRVSATLVKTTDAFQVWSETIDAKLDDIFDVQERVATRIVEALHVRLSPDEAQALGRWGTRSAPAYDEYLRGQVLVEHFHLRDKLEAARGHFERALAMDPGFAPALAGLASAEAQTYRNIDGDSTRLARAEELVNRALAIDPHLTRALFARGEIQGVRYDYRGAADRFRQVVTLEPRNYLAWDYLCWALGYQTPPRVSEAEEACRSAIRINPSYGESYYHLARVLIPQGRLSEAEQAIAQLEEHFPSSYLVAAGRFWIALGGGRPREALSYLGRDEPMKRTNLGRAWAAAALAQLGELDQAFLALDEALTGGYRDFADLRGSPYLEPLRRDSRFARLLAKHGMAR